VYTMGAIEPKVTGYQCRGVPVMEPCSIASRQQTKLGFMPCEYPPRAEAPISAARPYKMWRALWTARHRRERASFCAGTARRMMH